MLISRTATPRKTHGLLPDHCSIQSLNSFLSILSVTERAEGINKTLLMILAMPQVLPVSKLNKATSFTDWNFHGDNIAILQKRLSEIIIADFRIKPSNKYLQQIFITEISKNVDMKIPRTTKADSQLCC